MNIHEWKKVSKINVILTAHTKRYVYKVQWAGMMQDEEEGMY